jgi:hypothetical protein
MIQSHMASFGQSRYSTLVGSKEFRIGTYYS